MPTTRYNLVVLNDLRKTLGAHARSSEVDKTLEKINYNEGVDGIVLKQTSAKDIVANYGLAFDFYDLNGYSLEMKYMFSDFSCFFLQNDPQMKIFAVRMWPSCPAFQEHNSKVSSGFSDIMSLHDVFNFHVDEVESRKSYDETVCVDFGFYQYHFIPEAAPEEYLEIESLLIKRK